MSKIRNLMEAASNIKGNQFINMFDLLISRLIIGANYDDFRLFEFKDLSFMERKKFSNYRFHNRMLNKLNPENERWILDEKNEFNLLYNKFIKRNWLYMNKEVTFEDFKKFIKVNNQIIVKPTNLNQGRGINLKGYDISNQSSILSDYERFIKDKALIEERLFNHKKINQLNDTSLNSIRIYTVTDGVEVQIIKSLIRVGRKGSFIDNYHAGGLGASINSVTGKIDSDGVNFNNEIFSKHPDSGMEFKGFQIPMWEEVLSLVKEASLLNTKNKFVAWDIAITDNGVDIIEGNSRGCRHFLQAIDKIGKKQVFKKYYRSLK